MPTGVYTRTEKHRKSLSVANSKPRPWQANRMLNPESRIKLSLALRGKKKYPEAVSKSASARRGQKRSPEFRERMRQVALQRVGEKAANWQGGITPIYRKLRVARLKAVGGFHTITEWETLKAQYDWTCPACKTQEPQIKLTKDHIIPVSKGGSDNIENIQPLCGSCNSKKHTKTLRY